jgi:hypothetical protein
MGLSKELTLLTSMLMQGDMDAIMESLEFLMHLYLKTLKKNLRINKYLCKIN